MGLHFFGYGRKGSGCGGGRRKEKWMTMSSGSGSRRSGGSDGESERMWCWGRQYCSGRSWSGRMSERGACWRSCSLLLEYGEAIEASVCVSGYWR